MKPIALALAGLVAAATGQAQAAAADPVPASPTVIAQTAPPPPGDPDAGGPRPAPPGDPDAGPPPPPPPGDPDAGGPRPPPRPGLRGDPPPPPPVADIHIDRGPNGVARIGVRCAPRDTTRDCAEIASRLFDKVNAPDKTK